MASCCFCNRPTNHQALVIRSGYALKPVCILCQSQKTDRILNKKSRIAIIITSVINITSVMMIFSRARLIALFSRKRVDKLLNHKRLDVVA
ncbi:MAG: hypothetical protein A2511_16655 [Deltaproteobacteria bacterium RIFOXYD12_FULL_50_9]|nr:MAG: hypothetical protein A2511_16655 [Deltaproteobacteria bacterium RIFOXYD12_FULL_50_9]